MDSRPPRPWCHCVEPWQRTLYALLIPLFESACGVRDTDRKACFVTAPRGHSKTSTVAHFLLWSLCYSRRPITATAAAADKDQAKILLERMQKEASHNPWLARQIRFRNYQAVGPTGVLDVISSDAPSSSGRLDDILILDEVVWWKKRDLLDILLSGRNKRREGVLVVISNSGCKDTWQHELWLQARASPRWIAHEVPALSASWLDRGAIEDDRKLLLPSIFKRLHENRWVDLAEENAFVTREQLEACIDAGRQPAEKAAGRHYYVASIDVGLVHDRTVACVVHPEGNKVILDRMDVWQGSPDDPVLLASIEDWFVRQHQAFHLSHLIIDPWNLVHLAQKYERRLEVEKYNFQGGGGYRLAQTLRGLIVDGNLRIYPRAGEIRLGSGRTEDLLDEACSLIVVEKTGGQYRLDHLPDKHDDRTVALGLGALAAARMRTGVDPLPFLEELNRKPKLFGDIEMDYLEVKKVQAYGTWQACPVISGQEIRLLDYNSKDEAAWAVNFVHGHLGSEPPNTVDASRVPNAQRQHEIQTALLTELGRRRIAPPKHARRETAKD